ncbi:MAG: ABC transporter permease [Rikenellaceae bacterium]
MSVLWKLLRRHVSVGQLLGFFLSNLIGTTIVLLTIQIYSDMKPLFTQGDSFMKNDYMVVSKEVSTVSSLFGKSHTFTDEEIKDIENQSFTNDVGQFTSSQFEIYVSLKMPESAQQISSDIFFESVPDKYVDVTSDKWHFDENEGIIPIIMPRNYLNLYNFGFSQSRNLPKLSEGVISLINLDVRIRGRKNSESFVGNIVGFSDRLNTILVPQEFLDWANPHFSGVVSSDATRLILEVKNPADEAISTYFANNKYISESDKLDAGKITHTLRLIIYTVLGVGFFISLLSLYILMLSIFLLLEKNNTKIENLLLMGYTPAQVSRPYQILTTGLNIIILVVSITLVVYLRHYYIDVIDSLFPQGELSSLIPTIILGVVLMISVISLNYFIIRKKNKINLVA